MSLPRLWVPTVKQQGQLLIVEDPHEVHHARTVLRLRPGDSCVVCDGVGHEYHGRITRVAAHALTLHLLRADHPSAFEEPHVTLVQALPKGPAFEAILRHATELGVSQIQPVLTDRTVVRLPASAWQTKQVRWLRILREAAKQCRRVTAPELNSPLLWDDYARQAPAAEGIRVVLTLAVPAPALAIALPVPLPRAVTLCIGPEGDFTSREVASLQRQHGIIASVGERILRTETAALAALAIVQHEWSKQRVNLGTPVVRGV